MSNKRVLAIETSGAVGSVALECDGQVIEQTIATPREQTARALQLVDGMLAEAGIRPSALDALVFGRGPGSFTGLRVAAAVTQGLSLATGAPIVPVSSLAALAHRGFVELGAESAAGSPRQALCIIDARMGEVYSALYRWEQNLLVGELEEAIGPPESVTRPAAAYFVLGDAGVSHADALASVLAPAEICAEGISAHASDLLALAAPVIEVGEFTELQSALPVYLRGAGAWRRI